MRYAYLKISQITLGMNYYVLKLSVVNWWNKRREFHRWCDDFLQCTGHDIL